MAGHMMLPETSIGPIAGWHTDTVVNVLFIILSFITAIFLSSLVYHLIVTKFHLGKLHKFLPESTFLIIIGVIVGIIVRFTSNERLFDYVMLISDDLFLLFLIPPIVFEAGYSLNTSFFFRYFILILVYAVLGTLLNALCVSFTLWGFSFIPGLYSYSFELLEFLLFGALIAAVDPVAVLAVFSDVEVNETLNILVLGESVLNDAVSILLFRLFENVRGRAESGTPFSFGAAEFFLIIVKFIYMSVGGFILGVLFGLIGIFFSKFTYIVPRIEPMIVIIVAIASYIFGESILVSGIIAILFSAICLGHYLKLNITSDNSQTIKTSLSIVALIFESSIFLYIGVALLVIRLRWDTAFILLALAFTLLYRFVVTYFLTFFYNLIQWKRNREKVSLRSQFVMSYGGLRGAVSFSLSFVIPIVVIDPLSVERKEIIITATIFIILFTIFVNGGTIGYLIKLLKIPTASKSLKDVTDTLKSEDNYVKAQELFVLESINDIKNYQKDEATSYETRLKLTIKKIKKLVEILKKGNTQALSVTKVDSSVILKRKQRAYEVELRWKEYLNNLNFDQLAETPQVIDYCINYLNKLLTRREGDKNLEDEHFENNEEQQSTIINIENAEEDEQRLFQIFQQVGIITIEKTNNSIQIEEWAADDEYFYYLKRILNQLNVVHWLECARKTKNKIKLQIEGSVIEYDKLLYVLFHLLESQTKFIRHEIEHLRAMHFASKVFDLSINNTMFAVQTIAGTRRIERRLRSFWVRLDKWIKKLLIRELNEEEKSLIYSYNLLNREMYLEKELEKEEEEEMEAELQRREKRHKEKTKHLSNYFSLKYHPKVNMLRIKEQGKESIRDSEELSNQLTFLMEKSSVSSDENLNKNL
ncbi:hypothetical protein ABK040_009351 [Willaertia magna]